MSFDKRQALKETLKELQDHVQTMRPEECCTPEPMIEVCKGTTMVCSNDCLWQKLDLLLATAMVYGDIV